jgi:hypothetical protein
MGKEAVCAVRVSGRAATGKAHLDSNELTITGELRLKMPFAEISGVEARDGILRFAWRDDTVTLELGAAAPKWAHAILHPKSRIEKLGIAAGSRICALGCDQEFVDELIATLGTAPSKQLRGRFDAIFIAIAEPRDLAAVGRLPEHLEPAGALWLLYAKGRGAPVSEGSVREAMRSTSLVELKVVGFSATHTAVKWVIPKSARSIRPPEKQIPRVR